MQIIDGKMVSQQVREELKTEITEAKDKFWAPMGLAVIIVGENPASKVYVRNKVKACEEVGITSLHYELPSDTTSDELNELIDELNGRRDVNGILVQLPLPAHLNEKDVLNRIAVQKDVDGFSPYQMGKLVIGEPDLVACTPKGVMVMLERYGIDVCGMNVAILGRSNIVGKPIAHLMLQKNATVTICHTKTKNLEEVLSNADLVVVAVGRAKLVKSNMIKEGAIVVDVGINRQEDGKLCGDVDFEDVKEKCSFITPVPGGVGPMTITMLLSNTLKAYIEQNAR
ncbi:MAG: bifunctional methylenetetrahydrofolate dehydrogenase/methenyltetrahydrofolate cyclohydrolase FolD [Bacillota bacterium]